MESVEHILRKEGILVSFSMSKKLSPKELKYLENRIKKQGDKAARQIKSSIQKELEQKLQDNKIPGAILPFDKNNLEEHGRLLQHSFFSNLIAKKILEKKVDKYYMCFIVTTLVNLLGLSQSDFADFHKKFSEFRGEPPSEDSIE